MDQEPSSGVDELESRNSLLIFSAGFCSDLHSFPGVDTSQAGVPRSFLVRSPLSGDFLPYSHTAALRVELPTESAQTEYNYSAVPGCELCAPGFQSPPTLPVRYRYDC